MRIVTRPDFDGVVCATLLQEVEPIAEPTLWVEPSDIQKGLVTIRPGDILANLPYNPDCSLWFDHHFSNRIDVPFNGAFRIAPSAAGIIHDYYAGQFKRDYSELIFQTDKIDSADLTAEEVHYPQKFAYILLSMTITGRFREDEPYWNHVAELLRDNGIDRIMADARVSSRCAATIERNRRFEDLLVKHTVLDAPVTVTDFRPLAKTPYGNRFLVYTLYPEAVASMTIRYDGDNRDRIIVNVGHSIFNPNCNVNVGLLLSRFDGGGHRGAGSCNFPVAMADRVIPEIRDTLKQNRPIDS